jgi:hypothetical protein
MVVEKIDRLIVLDSSRAMNLVTILWVIWDTETPHPDPYNIYEECVFFGDGFPGGRICGHSRRVFE